VEETTVRDKAVEGIKRVLSFVKVKDVEQFTVDMVKRLLNGEGFTSKFAAA